MASETALSQCIYDRTGAKIIGQKQLSGGGIATVNRFDLENGQSVVVKSGGTESLEIEAAMLRHFSTHSPIPCPAVLHADTNCLVMDFIATDGQMSTAVQHDLAEKLAKQHAVTATHYGLPFDTLIGGLPQPNDRSQSWLTFFGEYRLNHMAMTALREGRLTASTLKRIEKLIIKLDDLIPDTPKASLLHGDLWGGNILCQSGKIAALIDPALYYGDREIELAFGTLFGDLTPEFFDRYTEISQIEPGFFEERRDLYNLYPLLVHVRLFGETYLASVEHILARFGV